MPGVSAPTPVHAGHDGGTEVTPWPREQHETRQVARQQHDTAEYAVRAGIEGTLSQGIRGFDLRQCLYAGLAKARSQHVATAAASDVRRISGWVGGVPRGVTLTSPFARLVA